MKMLSLLELVHFMGEFLIYDDIKDYGKIDRLHHWIIGELLKESALFGGLIDVISSLKEEEDSNLESLEQIKRRWELWQG